jgi:hypothetical protein
VLGPVHRRENWKTWKSRGENLDYHNQGFHDFIIKPFDNQTVSLPWLSRISDTSEKQSARLDSDNQTNISRLISCLHLCLLQWCCLPSGQGCLWRVVGRIGKREHLVTLRKRIIDYSVLPSISDTLIDSWTICNNQLFNSICKKWHFKCLLKHL